MNKKEEYRIMTSFELDTFKKYLISIEKAVKFLDEHFIDKEMKYVKENGEIVSVLFKKENFMHLCGVKYSNFSRVFFKHAMQSKIVLENVKIKREGTTFQKLKVLEYLIKPNISLTGSGCFLNISFDSSIKAGTRNVRFALTLKNKDGNCIPISLLNTTQDKHNRFPGSERVTSIEEYDLNGNLIEKHL